jgi:hypothetical protein
MEGIIRRWHEKKEGSGGRNPVTVVKGSFFFAIEEK